MHALWLFQCNATSLTCGTAEAGLTCKHGSRQGFSHQSPRDLLNTCFHAAAHQEQCCCCSSREARGQPLCGGHSLHLEEAIAAAMFQELAAESREDQSRDAEPRGSDYRCDQATSFLQLSCNVFSGSCMAKPCLQAARCVEITFSGHLMSSSSDAAQAALSTNAHSLRSCLALRSRCACVCLTLFHTKSCKISGYLQLNNIV